MRLKGLTETEIKRIFDFDWNNSDDEEGAEEEELYDTTLDRVIEETINQVKIREENVEINLITRIIEEYKHADEEVENEGDIENIVTETFEKINLEGLRWRNISLTDCETAWKEETVCGEVKDPIKYFSEFFDDEIINKICNETNLHSMQTKGEELNCLQFEIRRLFGVLLYLGVIQVPNLRMAWMPNLRLSAVADSLSRARFEKIKESFPSMQSYSQSPAPSDISNVSSQSLSSSAKRSYISEPPKSMRLDQVGQWVEWGAKGRCRLCQIGIAKPVFQMLEM